MMQQADLSRWLLAEVEGVQDGSRLPSEHDLARQFAVSRSRIRAAVDVLVERHAVRRVQGKGTYVNRPLDFVISREFPPSIHTAVEAQGGVAKTQLVDVAVGSAPQEIVGVLGCGLQEPVTRLTRIGWIDGRIALCAHEWIGPEVIDEVAVALGAVESLNEVLRMGRYSPRRSKVVVSAEYPPADVEARLQLPKPAATWVVDTVTCQEHTEQPLMASRTWSRMDMLRIVVQW